VGQTTTGGITVGVEGATKVGIQKGQEPDENAGTFAGDEATGAQAALGANSLQNGTSLSSPGFFKSGR
jgi:hypothetical protein